MLVILFVWCPTVIVGHERFYFVTVELVCGVKMTCTALIPAIASQPISIALAMVAMGLDS